MWVCIEIELTDTEMWSQVDKILCDNLGLTHVIWGVEREKNNIPVAVRLPANLFYGVVASTITERDLRLLIVGLLAPLQIGYNLMVIGAGLWSGDRIKAPEKYGATVDNSYTCRES